MSERDEASFTDEVVDGVLRGDRGLRPIQPGEPGYDDDQGETIPLYRSGPVAEREPLSDAERGRAFLERLRDRHADEEWILAGDVLRYVLELRKDPAEVDSGYLAALGRVLRGSE